MIKLVVIAGLLLIGLNGCSILVGGIVGAAITPFIQPQVDRVLGVVGADFVDPGGVQSVKQYDKDNAGKTN
jgi:hypothetical protein